jgi:flagellar biosynthesis protein FlhB
MGWKQAAGLLTIIFIIVVVQSAVAGPLVELQNAFLEVDFANEHWDASALITGMVSSWFNMGLVAIFLLMGATLARAVRKELTRQNQGP